MSKQENTRPYISEKDMKEYIDKRNEKLKNPYNDEGFENPYDYEEETKLDLSSCIMLMVAISVCALFVKIILF